jgi:hypothetical protein
MTIISIIEVTARCSWVDGESPAIRTRWNGGRGGVGVALIGMDFIESYLQHP